IGPAKRERNRGIDTRDIHLRDQVFGGRHTRTWIGIERAKPGITITVTFALLTYFRRKNMRMKINKHDLKISLCISCNVWTKFIIPSPPSNPSCKVGTRSNRVPTLRFPRKREETALRHFLSFGTVSNCLG